MALTPAETQRAYRQRLKQKEKLQNNEIARTLVKPFHEFFADGSLDFELSLALAGIVAPDFEDDRGPEDFVLNGATDGVDDPFSGAQRSLGRAEVIIDCLTDAAAALAATVNEYKRSEIHARLAEIEASDLSEPDTKKAALKNAARLNKMLDQLDKQVRITFPQWKVTG